MEKFDFTEFDFEGNNTKQSKFAINTAQVCHQLLLKWNDGNLQLPKEKYSEIQYSIEALLHNNEVNSHVNWEKDLVGLYDYVFNRAPKEQKRIMDNPDNFPMPRYVVFHKKSGAIDAETLSGQESKYYNDLSSLLETYTVRFLEEDSYFLNPDDSDFGMFFAYQLFLTDVMETNDFLQYHLLHSFQNKVEDYKLFLENIAIEYRYLDILSVLITKFTSRLPPIAHPSQNEAEPNEISLRKKVLAMKYLFDEIDLSDADRTAIANFIKFITGKESNQKTKDGNIYKMYSDPFPESDKKLIEELTFIRPYFEKLGLSKTVGRINHEINTKSKI